MGTVKKLKDEQDRLKEAENAVPGAYESQYTGQVNDRLGAMGTQNDAGFDYNTTDEAFRQYKARVAQNAQNGAAAANATAQSLAGGYGADWASSVTQQAAADQTASAGTGLAALRGQALQEWQNELSRNSQMADTLLGQDSLERSEANSLTGDAQSWRDYLYGRVGQTRQENSDFWNNVWNSVLNVGQAVLNGYDSYKGYTQQQWENDFKEKQYNDSLNRTRLSDQIAAMEQAQAFKQAGFDELANQTLAKYGLDSTMLDAWSGMTDTQKDQMAALLQGANLAAGGNDTAAKNYLQMAGVGTDSIDYSGVLNQRELANQVALQQALNNVNLQYQNNLLGVKSRYSSTGSSGGSGNSTKSSGFTNSQLQTMAGKFSSMSKKDPLYDFYKQTLTDAGWLEADSTTSTESTSGTGTSTGTGKTGTGTAGGNSTGTTASGLPKIYGTGSGVQIVSRMRGQGYSDDDIMKTLMTAGYSDADIVKIMNK